ncbi:putative gp22 [Burkholderia thailandensis USAMRU Malaysia |uniref:Gp22 n=1 Tax=Burkholderia thailandensis (strain ATCC 700388 / DSM 13276 / CCUG 48851 / CIP 106301 / E264) TaxID=271848 RepID=Q2T019_BURTA|nr:hypothetical protein [Burkholderia thailandensis]ABC39214.1 gp22 [Burkholderia thailandensis E264]AHI72997.1 putative gp22 [Burkholderia thailandensis 2002721723]AHI78387.1 putative gp22 [Burkholderia thailandensis E444]AIC88665.1 putative gp22 [Burkholderia thailandensis USAMRU Malaysia \
MQAGRYRATAGTWAAYLTGKGARAFAPVEQDRYALELLAASGALALIDAGRLADALACAAVTWSTLGGVHEDRDVQLRAAYARAGGQIVE